MLTIVWLFIAAVTAHVAGTKLEATEGQNVAILFETKLDRIDDVRIIFEGKNKEKVLIAQYCSRDSVLSCILTSEHPQVEEGNVSLILQNVNRSKDSGLYRAKIISANILSEFHVTLVVNKAPFSSSPTLPHPTTPKSSNFNHYWLALVIVVVVVVVILRGVCFWRRRRKCRSSDPEEARVQIQSLQEVKNNCNGCGGNAEALLPS